MPNPPDWNPGVGDYVCDCRYRHVKIREKRNDDDIVTEDGFACSIVHCCNPVDHEWKHPHTAELVPGAQVPREYDEDLRRLTQRVVGFVHMSLQLNTIIETVGVLRANPEFAKHLLGLSEKSDAQS